MWNRAKCDGRRNTSCGVEVLAGPAIVFVEIQYNLGSGTGAGRTWSFLSAACDCERRLSSPVHWFRRRCHGPPWPLPHLHLAATTGGRLPPPLLSPCWLLAVEAAGLWPPRQNRRRSAVSLEFRVTTTGSHRSVHSRWMGGRCAGYFGLTKIM
jgi:hypothetical protein